MSIEVKQSEQPLFFVEANGKDRTVTITITDSVAGVIARDTYRVASGVDVLAVADRVRELMEDIPDPNEGLTTINSSGETQMRHVREVGSISVYYDVLYERVRVFLIDAKGYTYALAQ